MTQKERAEFCGISPSEMVMNLRSCQSNDAYDILGNAIAAQAVKDFNKAQEKYRKSKTSKAKQKAKTVIDETTEFFCSDWFTLLTGESGCYWLSKIVRCPKIEMTSVSVQNTGRVA